MRHAALGIDAPEIIVANKDHGIATDRRVPEIAEILIHDPLLKSSRSLRENWRLRCATATGATSWPIAVEGVVPVDPAQDARPGPAVVR
jgi:hypothetical protein